MPNILKALQAAAGNGPSLAVDDVFSVSLYTGNGSTQSITNGIDLDGEGGLVWIKNRDQTDSHILTDTARGAGEILSTDATTAETTDADTTTAFNSDGFSIGADVKVNTNTEDYASWTFRKAPGFFDVVTYAGDGTNNRDISHSLGGTFGAVIVKRTDGASGWWMKHKDFASTCVNVNTQNSFAANSGFFPTSLTGFDSDSFRVNLSINTSGQSYVAYVFAHDVEEFAEGSIIQCGSYTGTATSGNSVTLGWEPQFLMIRNTTNPGNMYIFDTTRGMSSSDWHDIRLNFTSLENSSGITNEGTVDATGFTINTPSTTINASGDVYAYIAIRAS